jgi:hypothetical protein
VKKTGIACWQQIHSRVVFVIPDARKQMLEMFHRSIRRKYFNIRCGNKILVRLITDEIFSGNRIINGNADMGITESSVIQ